MTDCTGPMCYYSWTVHLGSLLIASDCGQGAQLICFYAAQSGDYLVDVTAADHPLCPLDTSNCNHVEDIAKSKTVHVTDSGQTVWVEPNELSTCDKPAQARSASCGDVTWSVLDDDGRGSIDQNGRLTILDGGGDGMGMVTVRATAAGSGQTWDTPVFIRNGGCGSCSNTGDGPSAGSVIAGARGADLHFDLGRDSLGQPAGAIWVRQAQPTTALGRVDSLHYYSERVDVVFDQQQHLRQVSTADCLADIVTDSTSQYSIRYFTPSQVTGITNGIYTTDPTTWPYVIWQVQDVNTNGAQIQVTKLVPDQGGNFGMSLQYVYASLGGSDWSLTASDVTGVLRTDTETWNAGARDHGVRKGPNDPEVYHVQETWSPVGITSHQMVTQRIVDPAQASLVTTRSLSSNYRLTTQTNPDGSWLTVLIDGSGRISRERRPWKNQQLPESGITQYRDTEYDFAPNDPNREKIPNTDPAQYRYPDWPRTISEWAIVGGQSSLASKTYYVYPADGVLEESRALTIDPYGAGPTLKTTTTFTAAISNPDAKPASIQFPDGRFNVIVNDQYGFFNYNAADPPSSTFAYTVAGVPARRTIVRHGTVSGYVANKSTFEATVTDYAGHTFIRETRVFVSGLNPIDPDNYDFFPRVDSVVNQLDSRGRATRTDTGDGTHSTTSWDCCNQSDVIDATGTETTYTYDGLGRTKTQTKVGITGSQAPITTSYGYDAVNRLTSTVVQGGSLQLSTSTQYDLAGRVTDQYDEALLDTHYDYQMPAGGGRHETITYPGALVPTQIIDYFADGRTASRTGTAVVAESYDYGIDGATALWSSVTAGPTGSARTTKTVVDLAGRTTRQERPVFQSTNPITTNYSYNDDALWNLVPLGMLARTSQAGFASTLYEYDALAVQSASGQDLDSPPNNVLDRGGTDRITETQTVYSNAYDAAWNPTRDWWLVTTTQTYAENGSSTPTPPTIQRRRLTGLPTSGINTWSESVDINGNVTRTKIAINAGSKLVTQTTEYPDSSTAAQTVTSNGLLVSSRTKTGLTYTYAYDDLARRFQTIDPRTGPVTTAYHSTNGRVLSVTDNASNATTYDYYSDTGRLKSTTNALTKTSFVDYNTNGQVVHTWGHVPNPTEAGYDGYGQRTSLSTFRGGSGWTGSSWPASPGTADTTNWTFDGPTALLTRKTYADGKHVDYSYVAATNQLQTRTWARQVSGQSLTTTYAYLPTGELGAVTYSDSTPQLAYAYKRHGGIDTVTESVGGVTQLSRAFSYNGALQQTADAMTGLINKTLSRSYSTAAPIGRPTGFSVASEYTTAYGFDSLSRLNNVTGPGLPGDGSAGTGAVYTFTPNSDTVGEIDLNSAPGTTVARTIRSFETTRDLITSIENKWGTTQISKYVYQNDAIARRSTVVMTGSQAGGDRHIRFAYDDRNELTEAKWYNGIDPGATTNAIGNRQFTYHFDCIGNRTDDTGDPVANTTLYTSNVLNQYASTTSPSETFFYDDDGNLIQDGTRTYSWDAENRLIATSDITLGAKALKIQYKYDYMGRRVRKTTYTAAFNGFTWNWNVTPNVDRKFVYDGWNLIEELNALSSDTPVCKYTWGLDLAGQSGNPSTAGIHAAGGIGGLLAMYDATGGNGYLYCFDANGNVSQLINSSTGAISAQYEYYSYGGELVASGTAATINPFRFSTKYWDATANLLYFGHRYLKPKMGRWLNRDPLSSWIGDSLDDDGSQTYEAAELAVGPAIQSFVHNQPVGKIDPHGLKASPSGCCGPDITKSLFHGLANLQKAFMGSPPERQLAFCRSMYSPRGWDLNELFDSASAGGYVPFETGGCGTGNCAGTVFVFGKCYRSADVNYILFGRANKLCWQAVNRYTVGYRSGANGRRIRKLIDGTEEDTETYHGPHCGLISLWRKLGSRGQRIPPNKVGPGTTTCRCKWSSIGWELNFDKAAGCDEAGCSKCGGVYTTTISGKIGGGNGTSDRPGGVLPF